MFKRSNNTWFIFSIIIFDIAFVRYFFLCFLEKAGDAAGEGDNSDESDDEPLETEADRTARLQLEDENKKTLQSIKIKKGDYQVIGYANVESSIID